jgi:hypothetical protein
VWILTYIYMKIQINACKRMCSFRQKHCCLRGSKWSKMRWIYESIIISHLIRVFI